MQTTICYFQIFLMPFKFIAPSLNLQGDQAVDAHAARAPVSLYPHFLVSTPIFYSKVDFSVHFVTLDNYAGRSDSLGIVEFSQ